VSVLSPRQAHLLGVLRYADENWLELWTLAKRADYGIALAAANVRELRHRQLVVTRPIRGQASAIEVSLAGVAPHEEQR
jgi:hypothetical protein